MDPCPYGVWYSYVVTLADHVSENPLLCALLAYFVRAERTVLPEEFILEGQKAIEKEIAATQLPNKTMQLDYRSLFSDTRPVPIHKELELVPNKTIRYWNGHLANVKYRLSQENRLIFPHFNAKKTVSYPTQSLLYIAKCGIPSGHQITAYTSADLLRHYFLSGEMI